MGAKLTVLLGTIAKLGHYPMSVGVLADLNAWFCS